jgi:hypothetical protein
MFEGKEENLDGEAKSTLKEVIQTPQRSLQKMFRPN